MPAIASGSGSEIAEGVLDLLAEWGVTKDHIVGMSFDTTASNTGACNGACVILEEALECKMLFLPCRRHVSELHIKHVAEAVGRPTKGAEDVLFRRFSEAWNKILEGKSKNKQTNKHAQISRNGH